MNKIEEYSENTFEGIKHINEYGQEYWLARELQRVLGYTEYGKFLPAINRAIQSCEASGAKALDHFAEVSDMIEIGKGAKRKVDDYQLSRYACYLIVMNGDPRKEIIALGQTYFAVKTRQQELIEDFDQLTEDQKRLAIRAEMTRHRKTEKRKYQG